VDQRIILLELHRISLVKTTSLIKIGKMDKGKMAKVKPEVNGIGRVQAQQNINQINSMFLMPIRILQYLKQIEKKGKVQTSSMLDQRCKEKNKSKLQKVSHLSGEVVVEN